MRVAAIPGATNRTYQGAPAVARIAQKTAPTAANESHAPTECAENGSKSRRISAVSASTATGGTSSCRKRA